MYKYFYEWWNEINNTIWPFSVPYINTYTILHQPISIIQHSTTVSQHQIWAKRERKFEYKLIKRIDYNGFSWGPGKCT